LESAIAADAPIRIPTIVLFELRYGIVRSARPKENAAILAAFLTLDVSAWPFKLEDAEEAGDIRAELERAGTPIGPYDVLIAVQARRRGAFAGHGEHGRIHARAGAENRGLGHRLNGGWTGNHRYRVSLRRTMELEALEVERL
jgi:predicted nucleic acid-binding protein